MKRNLEIAASVTGQFARVVLRVGFVLCFYKLLTIGDASTIDRINSYREAHGLPSLACLQYNTAAQCQEAR